MKTFERYDSPDSSEVLTEYYAFMDELSSLDGVTAHNLLDSAGGVPIYGYSVGDLSKPVIMVDGCIHNGHELKSAHSVAEILKVVANPSRYSAEEDSIRELLKNYAFYFIPVINADVYAGKTGYNANGVQLDYNFDYKFRYFPPDDPDNQYAGEHPFSEPETQNIKNVVDSLDVQIYVNMHTVGNGTDLMMARKSDIPEVNDSILHMMSSIKDVYSDIDKPTNLQPVNWWSSSYNWAGTQYDSLQRRVSAGVIEPGLSLNLQQNRSISVWSVLNHVYNVAEIKASKSSSRDRSKFFRDFHYFKSIA